VAERERVKRAVEAPVEEAAKLLSEASGVDLETRLAMRIDGWGRGLAAGIEELALAVETLRLGQQVDEPRPPRPVASGGADDEPHGDHERHTKSEPPTEDELRADAARSREETAALREESKSE
jgi:hypothetical protein